MKQSNINHYQKFELENEVAYADPHRLVQMLFEGAMVRLSKAKVFIDEQNREKTNEALGRVAEILGTLQESLDLEKGGNVANNLYQLYDYLLRRLLIANKDQDKAVIDEVLKLLAEVKLGWDGIRDEYVKTLPTEPGAVNANKGLSESLKA